MTTKSDAWYWLTNTERGCLRDLNPDAETIVNGRFKPDDLLSTERTRIPDSGKAWLPEKHILIRERSREFVEIRHPLNPDFTKYDYRWCAVFKARKPYQLGDLWGDMVRACMKPPLLTALKWVIYDVSGNGTQHLYLNCDIEGVSNHKSVMLYVPYSYFNYKTWNIVEDFHEKVAVGYYKGSGFSQPEDILKIWQERTRAALTCLEAKVLRAIVENKL